MMVSLIGRQLDHLLVLSRSPGQGELQWVCRCSCGNTAIIRDNPLRMGRITSCGCRDPVFTSRKTFAQQLHPAQGATYNRPSPLAVHKAPAVPREGHETERNQLNLQQP